MLYVSVVGIKFASVPYGRSSDTHFCVVFLKLRVASATWKLAQGFWLTNSKQNHRLTNNLLSFLLFPNKMPLPSQKRQTSKGSQGTADGAEHWASTAPYADCGTERYCAGALFSTQKDQGHQHLYRLQKPKRFAVVSPLNSRESTCTALISVTLCN